MMHGHNRGIRFKQFNEQHVERKFLAEFKMSNQQESNEEHVGVAKIYREVLGAREKQ